MRGAWTALAAIVLVAAAGGADAHGRRWAAVVAVGVPPSSSSGSPRDLVAVAERYLGMSNFTGLPGAWCAWAVSAWLHATGRPELSNGLAASALTYGPLELHARRGDLVVMRTRRGPYGHVGVVVADEGEEIEIISGNWLDRVARARISRRSVTAFVRI
jgi:hypothetical protein